MSSDGIAFGLSLPCSSLTRQEAQTQEAMVNSTLNSSQWSNIDVQLTQQNSVVLLNRKQSTTQPEFVSSAM